jgi:SAM-dependent methyltransferase
MGESATGQINGGAAEVYEEFFVPALFAEWPARLLEAANVRDGHRVLDVACGTGVLARHARRRVGPSGSVIGLDLNPGMLAVARRKAPEIEWRLGPAEALPFEPGAFDAVVSQFGLMFFEDPRAAIAEMVRSLRSGGRLAVAVWDSLERTPGYAALSELLRRLFGEGVAGALRAPFRLGDTQLLLSLFSEAGLPDLAVATHTGRARFPSIRAWMHTDVRGWTLADVLSDEQYARLVDAAEDELKPFVGEDGRVEFPSPAHVVSGSKP